MPIVLHVLSSMKLGGAERVTLALTKHQRDQGLDARILNLGSESDFLVAAARADGIPLTIIGTGIPRRRRYPLISKLFKQFDVVHIHSPSTLAFIAPLLPVHRKVRFIYTRHGLAPLKALRWRVVHLFARSFIYKTTFVTQAACDVFRTEFKWPDRKTVVIENGIYIPADMQKSPAQVPRFGSVGRMIDLKGQHNLLRAIAAMHGRKDNGNQQPFELHFYGSGPLEDALKKQATEIPGAAIFFHGEVADISSIYNNLDVLIVASRTEGLSMVIIEAMAHGLPIIATRVGGNSTLVVENESGILVEHDNDRQMQDAINRLLQHPQLRRRFGQAGRQHIAEMFPIEKTHQAYLALYSE